MAQVIWTELENTHYQEIIAGPCRIFFRYQEPTVYQKVAYQVFGSQTPQHNPLLFGAANTE